MISLAANLGLLGILQVLQFLRRQYRPAAAQAGGRLRAEHHSAAGHQLSHVPEHVLRGRRVSRRAGSRSAIPIDYALFISFFPQLVAGPIVRAREFFGDLYHGSVRRSDDVLRGVAAGLAGTRQEDGAGRSVRADRRMAIFRTSAAHPGAVAAWRGVIAFAHPDLFRFLRLHRHGHRHGAAARLPFPGEFPPAVSRLQHHRFLASLAHLAVALAARLSLHSAGRQSARPAARPIAI